MIPNWLFWFSSTIFSTLPPWCFSKLKATYVEIIIASSVKDILIVEVEWSQYSSNIGTHKTGFEHPSIIEITIHNRPMHEAWSCISKWWRNVDIDTSWIFLWLAFFQVFYQRLCKWIWLENIHIWVFVISRIVVCVVLPYDLFLRFLSLSNPLLSSESFFLV